MRDYLVRKDLSLTSHSPSASGWANGDRWAACAASSIAASLSDPIPLEGAFR
jgi:hypothetical protein